MGEEDTLRLMDAAWSVAGGAGQEARRDLIGIIRDTARNLALGAEVVGGGRLEEISLGLPRLLSRWWGWTHEHARGKADGVSEERGCKKLLSAFPSAAELMAREIPPVRWVVPGMVPEGVALLAGKPKLGKAQPIDANVLTPTGWRAMGELGVGDEVIGSNGKPTRVSAVYPQGIQRRYTITVSGGYSVEATEDYLWNVQTHNDRTQGRGFRTLSTGEIAAGLRKGKVRDAYLPTVRPVEFGPVTQDLPLDPYLLGLLLGDGSLTKNVTLTSRDEELFEEADRRLPQGALLRSYRLLGMLG
jgi:hypothetical protein